MAGIEFEQFEFHITSEERQVLIVIRDWVRRFFEENEPSAIHRMGGHGFDKCLRVVGWSTLVATGEGFSPFLPSVGAYLMDIGRTSADPRAKNYGHGQLSREMSAEFIQSLPVLTDEEKILVSEAIEDHPKLNANVRPTWLVKILMDADRLDCLSPLGPLRAATGLWDKPLILPEQLRSEGTTWDDVRSVYDGMRFQLAWYEMLWTDTARNIAGPKLQAYRQYQQSVRDEAAFIHKAYQKLLESS